ncbi:hypothetical protein Bbelb_057810 [Branchiostoma belcheri]|nr:hypothetical protein Bbelb_057810 [Branchiostoma belcheri]
MNNHCVSLSGLISAAGAGVIVRSARRQPSVQRCGAITTGPEFESCHATDLAPLGIRNFTRIFSLYSGENEYVCCLYQEKPSATCVTGARSFLARYVSTDNGRLKASATCGVAAAFSTRTRGPGFES